MLELPSGLEINPFLIRTVSKNKHFWSEKFYVTLVMHNDNSIECEYLTSDAADALVKKIEVSVNNYLSSATLYDEAYEIGRSEGHDRGYKAGHDEGYTTGFQEAKDAFWLYDREEYRINEYNLGHEAGKRDEGERLSGQWTEGYEKGRDQATDDLGGRIADLESKVARLRDSQRYWLQRAAQAEAALSNQEPAIPSATHDETGRYNALRRALAKLFHPDNVTGSAIEKAIRQEIFKEIWSEIERIEKNYTA